MSSKIRFNRIVLESLKYDSTYLNKTKIQSLNKETKDIFNCKVAETPIEGITAHQDCNYFLAKGARKKISIPACQIGKPFTNFSLPGEADSLGLVSYLVQPGLVKRLPLSLYNLILIDDYIPQM